MRFYFSIILCFFYLQSNGQIKLIKTIPNNSGMKFWSFTVLKNPQTKENYLVLYSLHDEHRNSKLTVYNSKFQLVLEKVFTEYVPYFSSSSGSHLTVLGRKNFHFMGEKHVYILDVEKREIDSVKLPPNRYENLNIRKRVYYEQLKN